jgi:carbon monoxide dehydrogenase subunit G
MRYETQVAIHATPEAVWAVLAEVERWPEWTPSMTLVRRLERGR